ncbi:MAG TPA: hypothetical protein PKE65_09790, partial [Rhizobiaceae bacterium]|nr:hypothetical protein [Rhizobiaceae bacterium]
MRYARSLGESWSPLHFLSALGAGGLSVSFFMYIMFGTPHPGHPIPYFDTVVAALTGANLAHQILAAIAVAGILYFAVMHVRIMVWNFRQYAAFKRSGAYERLRKGNNESQLMAAPLAVAMSINVGFILGAVFVPGLWSIRELLFPGAILAFALTGWWALRIYLDFMGRVLVEGGFSCADNNSLGQMLAVFTFAMGGVGFSASPANSHEKLTVTVAFIGATFFLAAATVLGVMKLILGFRAMMEHKAGVATAPTLWILIPFLTVLGIGLYRLRMALAHTYGVEVSAGGLFAFLTAVLAIQALFGLIGWTVMKRARYFERFVTGPEKSPGSFALICPGVAIFVFGSFFINIGLVGIGVVEKLSIPWYVVYLPLVWIQ